MAVREGGRREGGGKEGGEGAHNDWGRTQSAPPPQVDLRRLPDPGFLIQGFLIHGLHDLVAGWADYTAPESGYGTLDETVRYTASCPRK